MSKVLTLREAALKLHVSEKSIRRYIHAGQLPATTVRGIKGDEYRLFEHHLDAFQGPDRGRPKEEKEKTVAKPKPAIAAKKTELPPKRTKQWIPEPQNILVSSQTPIPQPDNPPTISELTKIPNQIQRDTSAAEMLAKMYDTLFARYEHSIGESTQAKIELVNLHQKFESIIGRYKNKIAEQEELIQELYQIIQLLEGRIRNQG